MQIDSINVRVGKKIRPLREEQNFTQEYLAFISNLHRAYNRTDRTWREKYWHTKP